MTTTPGATLTPHFRDFLPDWLTRQPWYAGTAPVGLALVGSFRLEDRDGQVGLETHLLGDGSSVYQVPMSYRGEPLPGAGELRPGPPPEGPDVLGAIMGSWRPTGRDGPDVEGCLAVVR